MGAVVAVLAAAERGGEGEAGLRAAPTAHTKGSRERAQQGPFGSVETGPGTAASLPRTYRLAGAE